MLVAILLHVTLKTLALTQASTSSSIFTSRSLIKSCQKIKMSQLDGGSDNVARRSYGNEKCKVLAATVGFPRSPPTRKKDTDSTVSTGFSSHFTHPKFFRWCRHGAGPIHEKAY